LQDPKNKQLKKLLGEKVLIENRAAIGDLFEKLSDKDIEQDLSKISRKINQLEQEINDTKNNIIYQNAFEWRFEFPEVLNEEGDFVGFDVIVGNPPYLKEYEGKKIFDGLRNLEVYQGKMDIWYLFSCLSVQLVKNLGYSCFIAQNNWTTNSGASKLRNYITNKTQIIKLIDFGPFMVFDNAMIQTMVMLFRKNTLVDDYEFSIARVDNNNDKEVALQTLEGTKNDFNSIFYSIFNRKTYEDCNHLFNPMDIENLLNKIIQQQNFSLNPKTEINQGIVSPQDFINKKSEQVTGIKLGSGIFVISNEELRKINITEKEKVLIRPYFTTGELKKYYSTEQNKYWIIYTNSSFKNSNSLDNYPNIKKHLDFFHKVITSSNKPYGLHRSRNKDIFIGEKIISLRKCIEPTFTYTRCDTYVSQTFNIIKSDRINLIYLTGLLNSSLIKYYLRYKGKMQGSIFQVDSEPLQNLPIKSSTKAAQQPIINLVTSILAQKQADPKADTSELETAIDALVYELYDLTAAEIALIEKG
jgi:adenine-specific DNA-methyltransferase